MRRKNINDGTIEGLEQDLWIGPLTLGQLDKWIEQQETDKKNPDPKNQLTTFDIIGWALTNATPDDPWDKERVRSTLDRVLIDHIWKTLMVFSGVKNGEAATPGESKAASAT